MESSKSKLEKEKERRKKRKELQKLKKKQDPKNLRSKNKTQSIVFTGRDVTNDVPDSTQQQVVQTEKNESFQGHFRKRATPASEKYEKVLRELEAEPASARHKIIDFFNRILVEYDDYANSIGDAAERGEWKKRSESIAKSLRELSFYMKKSHKSVPDIVIRKLLLIRQNLLEGNCRRVEELYMDMDVGNMVQENPKYKDLVMTPELLFQCLVNVRRLITFFTAHIIISKYSLVCAKKPFRPTFKRKTIQ